MHREYDLVVENNIMGIQLKSVKSLASEDVGESTRLDVQLDFSEIHVWEYLLMLFKALLLLYVGMITHGLATS